MHFYFSSTQYTTGDTITVGKLVSYRQFFVFTCLSRNDNTNETKVIVCTEDVGFVNQITHWYFVAPGQNKHAVAATAEIAFLLKLFLFKY